MTLFKKQIVVIGSSKATPELNKLAYEVGKEIARQGYILVCGGKGGIMNAACQGAKESSGLTVGIIPELNIEENTDNKYLDIVIPTGLNFSRNYIVQNSGSIIIMIGGSFGTLSELAYALQFKRKVIALNSKWANIDQSITVAQSPVEAVKLAMNS